MKIFKRLLLGILVLVALLAVVGLFLPDRYHVERTIVMNAPADAVFARANTLKTWPEWTAWTKAKYPDMETKFSGPDAGVGSVYQWSGKSSGIGSLRITAVEPAKRVIYDLDFENGKYLSVGSIILTPEGTATRVTWVDEGALGSNPINRWFGLMMDSMMGPDFETGLKNLKQLSEKPAK